MELTGTLLGGRYRVGESLGRGGMGVVYEAVQAGLDRRVALKVMYEHLATDMSIRERFKREARAVAMIRHPNVVQINDYVEHGSEPPFLVMERLEGETLRDLMKRGEISCERMVRIALQVLAALDAAHRAKIVHRDIKPDNIFLERTAAQKDIVRLLDFGVAKFLGETDDVVKLTRVGHAIGTPAFMAPEQLVGDAVDGRADLYALGATMFIALTGRKIYDVREATDLVRTIMTTVPPLVTTMRPDVSASVAAVIARALEKNASARFPNAMEMMRALAPKAESSLVPSLLPSTLVSPVGPVHDTIVEPAPTFAARPLAAPPSSSGVRVAVFSSLAIVGIGVVVGGSILAASLGGDRRADTPRVATPPAVTLTTAATNAPEIATLAPPPAESAPEPSATATVTYAPTSPTYSPSSLVAGPPECKAARLMKVQGQERQAAQLALVCMRKGGQPPF